MSNINIECEDDNYYDEFIEESSPRTNYGEGYKTEKMKDEYIIINKTSIQKRIDELEQIEQELIKNGHKFAVTRGKIDELISLLSQSTPLIPEIEKAYNAGKIHNDLSVAGFDNPQGRYISNLKLDI